MSDAVRLSSENILEQGHLHQQDAVFITALFLNAHYLRSYPIPQRVGRTDVARAGETENRPGRCEGSRDMLSIHPSTTRTLGAPLYKDKVMLKEEIQENSTDKWTDNPGEGRAVTFWCGFDF